MIRINAPKGLGDAIHVRAVVLHLLRKNSDIEVFSRWPEIFSDLAVVIRPLEEAPRHSDLFNVRACFQCMVPHVRNLSQFRNACLQAGVYDEISLSIDWKVRNPSLLAGIKSKAKGGKPILVYQPLKYAGNPDEQLRRPHDQAFRDLIASRADCFRIKIGHPKFAQDDEHLPFELDLFEKTSVTDAIDVMTIADIACSEPSFISVLAQAFDKNFVCLFSRRALRSEVKRVAGVTPQRICEKPHLATIVYDE